jgi:RNA methyltransferase, TrmH family
MKPCRVSEARNRSGIVSPSSRRPVASNAHSASVAAITRLISSADERRRTGLFFTEGLRFVARAVANPFSSLETAVVAPELLTNPFGHKLLRSLRDAKIPLLEVNAAVFRRLSRQEEPQGLGVVARQRWERLYRIRPDAGLCWLALDTVRAPGNLGTILRTMDAVGGAGLILLGDSIDPYDPVVVRATMGALFTQRFVRTTPTEFARWRDRHSVTLVGTSPHATEDYSTVSYPDRLVLWMGGERQGMTDDQMAACDRMVHIPMVGQSDSLNLATATAVLLYEVFNQRRRNTCIAGQGVGSEYPCFPIH